jgi:hypothetical protein
LTTAATLLIFEERFLEGAWTYFVFIPILYVAFTYFRSTLGAPSPIKDQLGELEAAMLGGFGFGQSLTGRSPSELATVPANPATSWQSVPARVAAWCEQQATFGHILVRWMVRRLPRWRYPWPRT